MIQLNVILFLGPGLFRTILIIVVIYYLFKFLKRYIFPLFISQPNQQRNFQQQRQKRPEGDVTVEGNGSRGGRIPKDEGEYVDFEEVD